MEFNTKRLPVARDDVAPDGSDVRILLGLDHGGVAHFELGPGRTSGAVAHKTVEEIWLSGSHIHRRAGYSELRCLTLRISTADAPCSRVLLGSAAKIGRAHV